MLSNIIVDGLGLQIIVYHFVAKTHWPLLR